MKVHVYLSGNSVHDRVLTAFYNGVGVGNGVTAQILDVNRPQPCDVAVVFGVGKKRVPISWPRGRIVEDQRRAGKPVVVLETGYVNRGDGPDNHYAAGLNGLNNRADFRNKMMKGDRWAKLGTQLQPWRHRGDHVLVIGQVPWDASVQHHDHLGWIRSTCMWLKNMSGRIVRFRPHPLARNLNYGFLAAELSTRPLADDFQDCHAVITYNSNTAVEAVIAGIPSFSFDDGSMAREVTSHDLCDIEKPWMGDREQWASNLAYAQWTPDEMARGWAWAHLFRP